MSRVAGWRSVKQTLNLAHEYIRKARFPQHDRRAGANGATRIVLSNVAGQEHNRNSRCGGILAKHSAQVEAVHSREPFPGNHDVGKPRQRERQRLPAVLCFLDFASALAEELPVHCTRVIVPLHEKDEEGAIEPLMRKRRCGSHFARFKGVGGMCNRNQEGANASVLSGDVQDEAALPDRLRGAPPR